jgi:hypothetical protein
VWNYSAGVDEQELLSRPISLAVEAISGCAGGIIYDGMFGADATVEKCRFADIWSPDNRHHIFGHWLPLETLHF